MKDEYRQYIDEWYGEDDNFTRQIRSVVNDNKGRRNKMAVYVYTYPNGGFSCSCPRCNTFLGNSYGCTQSGTCPNCGQSLDWSEVENGSQTEYHKGVKIYT